MAGLLARAKALHDRVSGRSREPSPPDFLREKEQEVMAEMDSILEKNRLKITDSTLNFTPLSSGTLFPAITNIGALALLVFLGAGLFLAFNRSETSLVSEARQLSSAEGRIIEAVRRASREEISRKEAEIGSIQSLLREAELSRDSLAAESERELSRIQAGLREELAAELEAERQRLIREGIGDSALAGRLAAFEEGKQREYDEKLGAVNAEFESRLREQSAALDERMEGFRRSLERARTEQDSLRASLERELAESRRTAAQALEAAAAEKSTAMERLENLRKMQEESRLVEGRILAMYDEVNTRLRRGEYEAAMEQLDRLEEFLSDPSTARHEAVAERRGIEQFLIGSLRRLIGNEIAARGPPGTEDRAGESARLLLGSITSRVEEGNRLFEAGSIEAAGREYAAAIRQIPSLETGYTRLRDMEKQALARERGLLEERLAEGDRLYRNSQYRSSVDRYREALRLLEGDTPMANRMITQLLDAGYRLRRADEPPPEPVVVREVVREELSLEEKSLIERARTAEGRRRALIEELDRLKARYSDTAEDSGAGASQEALVALLNAKLSIRRALSGDEIREEYPELYKTVDSVFESYGEERRMAGRSEALRDVAALTGYLVRAAAGNADPPLSPAEEARQRELLLEFLENLKVLLDTDTATRP